MMSIVTSMRPSFGERDAFRSALSQAYADGRIDDEEFARRSSLVETGRGADELRRALKDLPQPDVRFPITLTRSESEFRRERSTDSPTIRRRTVLSAGAVGAGILGFAVAGGFGHVFASGSGTESAGSSETPKSDGAVRDYLNDAAAARSVLDEVRKKGYRSFTGFSLYTDMVVASAQSLTTARGVDSITVYADAETVITPTSHLQEDAKLFALDDIAFDRVPAMARAALKTIGGRATNYADVRIDEEEPTITVYIDGDEYGVGSGSMEWTADGKDLIRIYREDED